MGKDNKMSMESRAKIMGIANITGDSYFAESRTPLPEQAMDRIARMLEEGADLIDIGACSTRPGSVPVDEKTEWARLQPVLKAWRDRFSDVTLSVDTFRAGIVERVYDTVGPHWVNDISAGEDDPRMLSTVGRLGLDYVAMHKRGTPDTMQSLCRYGDLLADLTDYFREFDIKSQYAGIRRWILDPGFGFAKTAEQNLELLNRLGELRVLNREILIGISRKSFIYKPLGLRPEDVLEQTTRYHAVALRQGASILRVHDPAPARRLAEQLAAEPDYSPSNP